MWHRRLQDSYSSLEEWVGYCISYALNTRLGFETPEMAWEANPMIQGSTNPADFGLYKPNKKRANKRVKLRRNYGSKFWGLVLPGLQRLSNELGNHAGSDLTKTPDLAIIRIKKLEAEVASLNRLCDLIGR